MSQGQIGAVEVHMLYSELRQADQDEATHWQQGMPRRIVLAASDVESSLHVPGVQAVVDFGLTREPYYEPDFLNESLHTVRSSSHIVERCVPMLISAMHDHLKKHCRGRACAS